MSAAASTTDRIEKRIVLQAPVGRVWRALADSREFGTWFQMAFEQPFVEGQTVRARVLVPGYDHLTAEFEIVRLEPERYFAYRWHPFAVDPAYDYSVEPTTLVEFTLTESGTQTVLTVVESGFDRLPLARRALAYQMNDGGWTAQIGNLVAYVSPA